MKKEFEKARAIIIKEGSYRETSLLAKPCNYSRTDTWNKDHKVVNVLSVKPNNDGHYDGCAVDIETESICG